MNKEISKDRARQGLVEPLRKGATTVLERNRSGMLWLEEIMKGTMTKEATIYINEVDLARLRKLIDLAREYGNDANRVYLDRLEGELDRAEVVNPTDIPRDVVTMRSRVRLKDLDNGKEMVYSLVFPSEADVDEGKVSVLAPVGTAMIGYRVGDVIEWEVPSGLRRLKVEEIIYQPEASGDYHL